MSATLALLDMLDCTMGDLVEPIAAAEAVKKSKKAADGGDFRAQAIARLAAQREKITRLHRAADEDARTSITRLPRRNAIIGSC
ncbi:hypothetical protein ACWIG3_11565 [Streptomyces celluloflavus]|uniref:Uncharacterized protein n=1 Tax=Streptomyces kasugaensis TaxID=1946 RepID=A0A4Q9HZW3_STRKA|nr:hypothetical protein [Streptomyces kasugaensis]TBO60897.1 hypothetical protein EYS09_04145 [Streptomyces kasugaensis]